MKNLIGRQLQKKDEIYFNYLEEEIMPRLNILIENGARNSLYRAIGLYLADMKNYEAKESFTKGYSIANTNDKNIITLFIAFQLSKRVAAQLKLLNMLKS